MVSVNLGSVVWLGGGDGHIDADGHLVTSSGWDEFAFPGINLLGNKSYRITMRYLPADHPDAEVDLYSLSSASSAGHAESKQHDLGWQMVGNGSRHRHLKIGDGVFTALLGPGTYNYDRAARDGESNILWYASPGMTITELSYEEVWLTTSDWQTSPDLDRQFDARDVNGDGWSTKGTYWLHKVGSAGGGYPPLSHAEIDTGIIQARKWPPMQGSPATWGGANNSAVWVKYEVGYEGGTLDGNPMTDLYVNHDFGPKAFQISRTFTPPAAPPGAIGYQWHPNDSSSVEGFALARPKSVKLSKTLSVMEHANSDQSTAWDQPEPRYTDPSFTTTILAAPLYEYDPYTNAVPQHAIGVPKEVTSYAYSGVGLLPEGESAVYPTTHALSEGTGTPDDVELLSLLHVSDNVVSGVLMTQNSTDLPAGPIAGSLFGTPDFQAGATLFTVLLQSTWEPPRYRWVYEIEEEPPVLTISGQEGGTRRRFVRP
jgi:hypothetical protein